MLNRLFKLSGLLFLLGTILVPSLVQAGEHSPKNSKIIEGLSAQHELCSKANNKAGSPESQKCKSCFHLITVAKRGLLEENIKKAEEACSEAVRIMNPETREDYKKRTEIEKLQKVIDKNYAVIKSDPNMTDATLGKVCDLYYRHIRYTETLPWKSFATGGSQINAAAMSREQKQELTMRKNNLRKNVSGILFAAKVGEPAYSKLFRQPNYCTLKYEMENIKAQ